MSKNPNIATLPKRVLLVKQPYLENIFLMIKTWEMRTGDPVELGRIALAEPKTGLITGEVDIVDFIGPTEISRIENYSNIDLFDYHRVSDKKLLKKWNHAWVLENATKYNEPIRFKLKSGPVIWMLTENMEFIDE